MGVGKRPAPQGIPGSEVKLILVNNLNRVFQRRQIMSTKSSVLEIITVPTRVTKFKNPTAGIKNISVAVMIDGKRVPQLNENGQPNLNKEGEKVMVYQEWSQEDLQNFSAIVTSIGLNTTRGDKITIKNMEFIQEDLAVVEQLMRERKQRAY